MNVAFFASEVVPFAKTGGLAEVVGTLPLALEHLDINVSIFMPCYGTIKSEQLGYINDHIVTTKLGKNIDIYFVKNDKYFGRKGFYGDERGDFPDNLERFQFFSETSLNHLNKLGKPVDIVHCHDWHTALIPVYLKYIYKNYKVFQNTRSVLTIHNLAFQGIFPKEQFFILKLPEILLSEETFLFYDQINLLKAGICVADKITTVSSQYAKEIMTPQYGCGLDGVLRRREENLTGILNGLDEVSWNPSTDPWLKWPYSFNNYKEKKSKNKNYLKDRLNIAKKDGPLFGFVGRLSHQKGVDLIIQVLKDFVARDLQVVLQGVGEEKYHHALREIAAQFPEHIGLYLDFSEELAHHVYAASDLFLMPSVFEPCGLSQMISMHYGTIPIVYYTGGLVDTVIPYDSKLKVGNGFNFKEFTREGFLGAIDQSVDTYNNKADWDQLTKNAFNSHFTWDHSAKEYKELYQCLLSE